MWEMYCSVRPSERKNYKVLVRCPGRDIVRVLDVQVLLFVMALGFCRYSGNLVL